MAAFEPAIEEIRPLLQRHGSVFKLQRTFAALSYVEMGKLEAMTSGLKPGVLLLVLMTPVLLLGGSFGASRARARGAKTPTINCATT